jgi:predicted AlkP superfamily phosphohydrolase/phosphomutase
LLQARRKPGDLPFRIAKKAFLGLQDNIPIGIQEALARFFPVLFVRANSMRLTQGVDLKRSLAHAQWDSSEVHLARSTAPEGEVGSSDAPSHGLLTRVIELLGTLYDPNARAGVRPRIWRASELYHGPFTDLAADLLLRWDGETLIREVEASEGSEHYRAEGPRDLGDFLFSGTHRPEGILMAAGPDVKAGERVSEASVCDIAPTLLRLLGLPVPEWMDGRVLQELLMAPPTQEWHSPQTQGLPSAKTPSSGEPYSRKEREAVLSRFRDWGYLD